MRDGRSVFDELEALLPLVTKPIQYVGGELNSQVKDWQEGDGQREMMWTRSREMKRWGRERRKKEGMKEGGEKIVGRAGVRKERRRGGRE